MADEPFGESFTMTLNLEPMGLRLKPGDHLTITLGDRVLRYRVLQQLGHETWLLIPVRGPHG